MPLLVLSAVTGKGINAKDISFTESPSVGFWSVWRL